MSNPSSLALRAAPALFVLIWATGFIVARLVAPYADPLTFLMARYALAITVLTLAALLLRASWPQGVRGWRDALIAGVLLHGFYLGGVFWAVHHGLPAAISALIGGLQPLLTAVLAAPLLGETVTRRRWLGIGAGFAGAVLVIAPEIGTGTGFPAVTVVAALIAMISMTLGTIWQKRTGAQVDMRTNAVAQFIGGALVTAPFAFFTEHGNLTINVPLIVGLLWSALGLSIGAITLLMILLRRGAVSGVASLFYLVPPATALFAFFLFGDSLSPVQIGGMALAALGVAIASRG
ncbi:MAG: DMT family transporter [Parvibaculaceae bacterium]|nr:DMT family transporter [Parvibaculaceae bacterium]